jgi:hypothetical protein
MNTAMHTRAGMRSPTGDAPVAARLAIYASLLNSGAPALPGSPSRKEAAALSRRIVLAWAAHGFRDAQDQYKQKPQ